MTAMPPLVPFAAPQPHESRWQEKLPVDPSLHDVVNIGDEVKAVVRESLLEGQAGQDTVENQMHREFVDLVRNLSKITGRGRQALPYVRDEVARLRYRMNDAKKLALNDVPGQAPLGHMKDFLSFAQRPIEAKDGSWSVLLMGPSPKKGLYRVEFTEN